MFAPGPVKGIPPASAIFALNLLCAGASQVLLEPLDKVAERIQAVWLVRIDGVTQTTNHMQLKDGSQGPVTSMQWDHGCTVLEVLAGDRLPTNSTRVTVRFSMIVPVKYDENGKKEFHLPWYCEPIWRCRLWTPRRGIPRHEQRCCWPFPSREAPRSTLWSPTVTVANGTLIQQRIEENSK